MSGQHCTSSVRGDAHCANPSRVEILKTETRAYVEVSFPCVRVNNHVRCIRHCLSWTSFIQKPSSASDDWSEKPSGHLRSFCYVHQPRPTSVLLHISGIQTSQAVVQKQQWRSSPQIKYFCPTDISDVHRMKKLVHQLYLLGKASQIGGFMPPEKAGWYAACMALVFLSNEEEDSEWCFDFETTTSRRKATPRCRTESKNYAARCPPPRSLNLRAGAIKHVCSRGTRNS